MVKFKASASLTDRPSNGRADHRVEVSAQPRKIHRRHAACSFHERGASQQRLFTRMQFRDWPSSPRDNDSFASRNTVYHASAVVAQIANTHSAHVTNVSRAITTRAG